MINKASKKTIGRKDFVDLPELGATRIAAKVDTGAYRCALHCHFSEVVVIEGKAVLKFNILDPGHPEYEDKYYIAEDFSQTKVRNTGGKMEKRYTIKTAIRIFGMDIRTDISLTNRLKMKHPLLLGRKFLRHRFIVDVSKKNISAKSK